MLALYQQFLARTSTRTYLETSERVFLIAAELRNANLTIGKGFFLWITACGEVWIGDVERAVITWPFFAGVAGYLTLLFCAGIIWFKYRKGIEVSVTEMYKRKSAELSVELNDDQLLTNWPLVSLGYNQSQTRCQLTASYHQENEVRNTR